MSPKTREEIETRLSALETNGKLLWQTGDGIYLAHNERIIKEIRQLLKDFAGLC